MTEDAAWRRPPAQIVFAALSDWHLHDERATDEQFDEAYAALRELMRRATTP